MYKIYKSKLNKSSSSIFYVLCEGDNTISWFYVSKGNANKISDIYTMNKPTNVHAEFPDHIKTCIYKSLNLQKATNYLEQLRVLENV